jgi:bifunctional non-homologous end joining protein LigD
MAGRRSGAAARKTAHGSSRGVESTARATRTARARLPEYEAKRDFSVTPEPPPRATPVSEGAPTFMVHKHHATRLHYDLRLEIDGALASWAIPKGPSYDPAIKRLAVQTEDHPLEYGGFEGRIPDDEYGGGDSLIWDRGTFDTVPPGEASAQRARGRMTFELTGDKLKGRWHLVRTRPAPGGKPQWLFFKAKDDHADPSYDVTATRPESVASGRVLARGPLTAKVRRMTHPAPEKLLEATFPPMLATLVEELPPSKTSKDHAAPWLFELKYDGFRALSAISGKRVAMWTRNALDLASRFPTIARALTGIAVGEAVIDGEIVAVDEAGIPRFQLLSKAGSDHAVLFAFDLLWLDGEDVRDKPLEARRDLLESVLGNAPDEIRIAQRVEGAPDEALARVAGQGYEGLIAKRRGAKYTPGRSRDWLKLKAHVGQELAIVGFTPNKGHEGQVGALLVAYAEGGKLRYAGKVGTGFGAQQSRELARQLAADSVSEPQAVGAPRMRNATWVVPKLVAQVRFTEWTADGKLRHPAFEGLRPDKRPLECLREKG